MDNPSHSLHTHLHTQFDKLIKLFKQQNSNNCAYIVSKIYGLLDLFDPVFEKHSNNTDYIIDLLYNKLDRLDILIIILGYFPNHISSSDVENKSIQLLSDKFEALYKFITYQIINKHNSTYIYSLDQLISKIPFCPWNKGFISEKCNHIYQQYSQLIRFITPFPDLRIKSLTTNPSSNTIIFVLSSNNEIILSHILNVILDHSNDSHIIIWTTDNHISIKTQLNNLIVNLNLSENISFQQITPLNISNKISEYHPSLLFYDTVSANPINFYLAHFRLAETQILLSPIVCSFGISTIDFVQPIIPFFNLDYHYSNKTISHIRKINSFPSLSNNNPLKIGCLMSYESLLIHPEYEQFLIDLMKHLSAHHTGKFKILIHTEIDYSCYTTTINRQLFDRLERKFSKTLIDSVFEILFDIYPINSFKSCDVLYYLTNSNIHFDNISTYCLISELLMNNKIIFTNSNYLIEQLNCNYLVHFKNSDLINNIYKTLINPTISENLQSIIHNKFISEFIISGKNILSNTNSLFSQNYSSIYNTFIGLYSNLINVFKFICEQHSISDFKYIDLGYNSYSNSNSEYPFCHLIVNSLSGLLNKNINYNKTLSNKKNTLFILFDNSISQSNLNKYITSIEKNFVEKNTTFVYITNLLSNSKFHEDLDSINNILIKHNWKIYCSANYPNILKNNYSNIHYLNCCCIDLLLFPIVINLLDYYNSEFENKLPSKFETYSFSKLNLDFGEKINKTFVQLCNFKKYLFEIIQFSPKIVFSSNFIEWFISLVCCKKTFCLCNKSNFPFGYLLDCIYKNWFVEKINGDDDLTYLFYDSEKMNSELNYQLNKELRFSPQNSY
jgi:hypothetical protein